MELSDSDKLIASNSNQPEPETFELVYDGPDVGKGTMAAKELAEVLTGLSRAFSAVAHEEGFSDQLQLRVRDIEANSFHLVLEAIQYAKSNPVVATAITAGASVALQATQAMVSGTYRVICDIAKMIDAKKKTKGSRIATLPTSFDDEHQIVIRFEDNQIVLTKEQYELLLSQRIDKQLAQIISPLEPKKIESFEIRKSNAELVRVDAGHKGYFDYVEVTEEKSKEGTQIVGTLNSLSKTNLRGTFYTADGVHVPYRYVGGDVAQLLRGFSAREPLRVHGKVKYGSDGVPTYVEVQDIEVLQRGFFDK